jgi:hypothetical protein
MARPEHRQPGAAPRPSATVRVLVTGQHPDVCAAMEHALAAAGFHVVPPVSAADADVLDSLRLVALVFQSPAPATPAAADRAAGVLELGDIVVDPHRRTVRRGVHDVDLGRREFDALVVLLRNTPWVVTKQLLLETVWNYGGYDPNVVEVAISGLRRKLESHGPRVIQTIRGLGYAARPQPPPPPDPD